MNKTPYYNYNMPEREDKVKIDDLNMNAQFLDRDIAQLAVDINTKAPIRSPQFAGEPMAPKFGTNNVFERIITIGTLTDALEVEVL